MITKPLSALVVVCCEKEELRVTILSPFYIVICFQTLSAPALHLPTIHHLTCCDDTWNYIAVSYVNKSAAEVGTFFSML